MNEAKNRTMNPSEEIDKQIKDLNDWRGELLENIRKLIHNVDPEIKEDWRWMGTACWYHNGLIALANPHKDKVKLTFYQGAHLKDPSNLFNNGLNGNKWRAIDFYEKDKINEKALKALIREAIDFNLKKTK
jgi:hypothetical protein